MRSNRDLSAKLATGKLLAIDNQVDVTTGTVKLKAVFQNENNLLFPNEFVSSRLLIDTKRNVILVPDGRRAAWTRFHVCLRRQAGQRR